MAKGMFNRSNGESKKRGVGGKRSDLFKDILDHPVCNNLCAGCGKEIPDPWYHKKSGKCFNCEKVEREEKAKMDKVFAEVIALESRRDAILEGFGLAEKTDELERELADIECALQGHYTFFDGVELARQSARFGTPL